MGTLTLSGVLKRPISGDVVPNARITFDAIATGNVVLKGVSSACKTASDGSYSVELEYGNYAIQVSWAGQTQQYGSVSIDDTTPIGSLNDLLMQELTESQLTPEIVLEFRQLEQEMQEDLAQMEGLNDQASGSASSAAASASAAATSETNSAASEDASAASAAAAAKSETNSAASEDASAASATAAKTSETNSAASEEASANSEINAKNARDAAEEYAQEAKDAASKVTNPLTDQGQWAIQTGYPKTPGIASIWQITDGGVDPVNSEIIWDAGDMLIYMATTGTWCRLLGQQTVSGEPVPLKIDADIILSVGSGLQIVTSGTTAVDIARLDTDNNLVLGADALPGIHLKAAEPTNFFVLVSDGNGGYTESRIYTEAFPPPSVDPGVTTVNGEAGAVEITLSSLGAGTVATLDAITSTTDTTAGHALTVGYEGIGGDAVQIKNGDFNQLLPSGFINGNTNAPNSTSVFFGFNVRHENAYQLTIVGRDGRYYAKCCENGNFQDWDEFFTTGHPPTATDVSAVPQSSSVLAVDLDTLTGSYAGRYYQSMNANATSAYHYPVQEAGSLDVIKNGANGAEGCIQEYRPFDKNILYRRNYSASTKTWSGWAEEYSTANPPPATDLSAYMKTSDANAKFVQGFQFGAVTQISVSGNQYKASAGCVLCAIQDNDTGIYPAFDSVDDVYQKSAQIEINSKWLTVAG